MIESKFNTTTIYYKVNYKSEHVIDWLNTIHGE